MNGLRPVPLTVRVGAEHGGRWTSLSGGGREWLWRREDPGRAHVAPGDAFVDAGGLEECVPTVRGTPDHGEVWSRAWTTRTELEHTALEGSVLERSVLEHCVRCRDFELTRRIEVHEGSVIADYRLAAEPGYRFVWAGHALLDLSERALLEVDQDARTRLFPEAAPHLREPWPDGAAWIEGAWPSPAGLRLDALGPDDGSAVGAVIQCADDRGVATAVVRDGRHVLRMSVQTTDGQPTAVALWRNLGGFPQEGPYRSIGVEPMLGRVFDLAQASGDGDCAVTPESGEVKWRLTIDAYLMKDGSNG